MRNFTPDLKSFPECIIICDGLISSGMGHLVRCAAIARALASQNIPVNFLLLAGSDQSLARSLGVNPELINFVSDDVSSMAEFVAKKTHGDRSIILIDTYGLKTCFYEKIHKLVPETTVFALDDFGEKIGLPITGVINGGLAAERMCYPGRLKNYSAIGPDFAPLPLNCIRSKILSKQDESGKRVIKKILLVMGASDPDRQTLRFAKIMAATDLSVEINIVLGPMYEKVEEDYWNLDKRFVVHVAPEKFHELAGNCDMAISGAGGTSGELLYLGVPLVAVCLAENQAPAAAVLESRNLAIVLGKFDELSDTDIQDKLVAIIQEPKQLLRYTKNAAVIFDGQGAKRTALRIVESWKMFTGRKYSVHDVCEEYRAASERSNHYEKVLWGTREGMINRFKLAIDMFALKNISSWLDIGCGPGDFEGEVIGKFAPKRFVGIDMCMETLSIAENRFAKNCGFNFFNQDFMQTVQGEPFSLVTALGVVHKCGYALHDSIERFAGLVETGGWLLMTTKNLAWKRFDEADFVPYSEHAWFLPEQLISALEGAGFIDVEIRGFEPRSGGWCKVEDAHSMMILARKGATGD